MFWLLLLALMLLVPVLAGVHTWRELRRGGDLVVSTLAARAEAQADPKALPNAGSAAL